MADGGWLVPGIYCVSRKTFVLTTSGGCDPNSFILGLPLKRQGKYPVSSKTNVAPFGSQPQIAFASCGGTGRQRRFTPIRKLKVCLRLETPRVCMRKIGQAIYG